MVRNGTFREDLYYRINTIRLELPPLRERQDEILPLAKLFIARYAEKYHRPVTGVTGAAENFGFQPLERKYPGTSEWYREGGHSG